MNGRASARMFQRTILFRLCLLLVMSLPIASPATSSQSSPETPDLDIVLVIDESDSMIANDPSSWRIVMADLFADLLGVDQSGPHHRLGIIVFGTEAELVKSLSDIQDQQGRDELKRLLDEAHQYKGLTDIPAALELAQDELQANGRKDAKQAVVFLSDGHCETRQNMTPEEIEKCNQGIRQLIQSSFVSKYPVYTIALSETSKEGQDSAIYKNLWQEAADRTGGLYFEPERAERDLLDVYIKIIRHLLDLPLEDTPPSVTSPTEVPFEIPEGLLQVVFTVVKDSAQIVTTVVRPDGKTVQLEDADVRFSFSPQTDSYSFIEPLAGQWLVRLSGEGKVTAFILPFPETKFRVQRLSPGATHPQGKPMDIVVRVVDADQQPQSPENLKVDIEMPDGSLTSAPFEAEAITFVTHLKDTRQLGTYVLRFSGNLDGVEIKDEQYIAVVAAPWLRVIEPQSNGTYPIGQPLQVAAQLMFGTEPLSDPDPNDQFESFVQLFDADGQSVDFQQLRLESEGKFGRTLEVGSEGTYQVSARLTVVKTASGETFQDVSEFPITVRGVAATAALAVTPTIQASPSVTPSPMPTATPQPSRPSTGTIAGLGALTALAVVGGGLGWWWFSKPSLTGALDVGGQLYPLSGKQSVVIGSDPRSPVPIQGIGVLPRHAELRPIGNRRDHQVELRSVDPSTLVRVNGMETAFQILYDGDKIEIGDQSLTYSGPPRPDLLDISATSQKSDTDWTL